MAFTAIDHDEPVCGVLHAGGVESLFARCEHHLAFFSVVAIKHSIVDNHSHVRELRDRKVNGEQINPGLFLVPA
jgi:hypothetical protein